MPKVSPIKKSVAKSAPKNVNAIVIMQLTKSTKNTHVYAVDEELTGNTTPVCTTVYLAKDALPETPPSTIQLTVSYEG